MDSRTLEKKLVELGYSNLFLSESHQLDGIWQDGKHKINLEQIINSDNSSLYAKFLASEVLRYYKAEPQKENKNELAKAYTYALKNTSMEKGNEVQLNGNVWGFLYEHNDVGYLGKKLISFNNAAVPHLLKLLNDNGSILYDGSQEAMIGNSYHYRIKDFAAYYISKIKNIPIQFYQDIEERDKEIERFKKLIKAD